MPSNSEMYELGALDAEHDDLNTFYYQHYYFYRRGYDEARRQQRGGPGVALGRWAPRLLVGLAALALGWYLIGALGIGRGRASDLAPTAAPALAQAAAPTPLLAVVATPPPTAAPSPSPPPQLQVGGRGRVVNVGDAPLRARAAPGLAPTIRVVARFRLASEVAIIEGPVAADGLSWWRIKGDAGEGWSAERSAEGLVFLEPIP